jgi:hypothetical protein
MANYIDEKSMASNPGAVCLSREKFKELRDTILRVNPLKKIYFNKQFRRIDQYLRNGDTQPAVVVSISPLIISVYSEDMDAVLFLKFPEELASKYGLIAGSRLVSSNVYFEGTKLAKDIQTGSGYTHSFVNFTPVIPLFLSSDEEFIRSRINLFEEDVWNRLKILTEEKASKNIAPRDGFYYFTEFNILFMIF